METLDELIQESKGANVVRGIISFIMTLVMGLIVVFKFFGIVEGMGSDLTSTTSAVGPTYLGMKTTVYLVFGLLTIFLIAVGAGVVMSAV
jgi:hypothetical protein